MAGHSKWANIKHKKARNDSARGKLWSKLSKAIIVAAKAGGGDPTMNLALRYAIDEAKSNNMPKDTIEKAVKKGSGELEGVNYEEITYEGYGPNGVAVFVEVLTDNKNRTVPEIKRLFDKTGGNLGTNGCVAYIFDSRGVILVPGATDEEEVMMTALDAGAEDVTQVGEDWQIVSPVEDFAAVVDAIKDAGIEVTRSELTRLPNNTVDCDLESAKKVMRLMEMFEDHDDVQKIYANFDISDEVMAQLEAEG